MANGTIGIPIGTDGTYLVALLDETGSPASGYTASDTPFARAWSGADTPVVVTPACAWVDAPSGTFTLTIAASATAALTPGKYRLRYGVLTSDNRTITAPDVFLEFTASPGTAAALTTYCTLSDMTTYAPWIEDEQDVLDETGFAVQRHLARTWLERVIQRHNPMSYWNEFAIPLFGFAVGTDLPAWNWGQSDPILQRWLDADYLRVTNQVAEISAKYALSLICLAQVGPNDKDTAWQRLGEQFYADAQRLVKAYTAEIYLPGNAIAPIRVIPCGRVTLR